MKVVLFCGGMGMRMREHSEVIPKPMVTIGNRPILWHLMKYYAHFGHKEFILCLGWKGSRIKEFFLHYDECVANDFTLEQGKIALKNRDIHDWKITFVDTGQLASVGERLVQVRELLADDEVFLANYSDALSDLHLPNLLHDFNEMNAVATCLCVKPRQSFHLIKADDSGIAQDITPVSEADQWMNGGFFALRNTIFDYMRPGEDLAGEPFQRLIANRLLGTYQYEGFWGCMDTFKELQLLESMNRRGNTPWKVWENWESTTVAANETAGRKVNSPAKGERRKNWLSAR